MALAPWVEYMLTEFTPAQLQHGFEYNMPKHRYNRAEDGHWILEDDYKFTRGTGIPASTFHKFQQYVRSGGRQGWKPGEKTLAKLSPAFRRFSYGQLRANGASTQIAKAKSTKRIYDYYVRGRRQLGLLSTLEALAVLRMNVMRHRGITELEAVWSLSQSGMTAKDIDSYDLQKLVN